MWGDTSGLEKDLWRVCVCARVRACRKWNMKLCGDHTHVCCILHLKGSWLMAGAAVHDIPPLEEPRFIFTTVSLARLTAVL